MALTKLMHMKETKKGNPARHLRNGIQYIMKDGKTENGRWIGGNAGSTWQEAYHTMLGTKQEFGKLNGRQGYHFVISFKEDAAPEKAYQVMEAFCQQYLGDRYDYVFSVHTDSSHIHAHVIFNSVSRLDGLKYHYKKGDWEKYIQPVTDKICLQYGFEKFQYEGDESRNYGEWLREQEGKKTWRDIVREDIDRTVPCVKSVDQLCHALISMGYTVKKGTSREKGEYLVLKPQGARKAVRTKTLGNGYLVKDLELRIRSSQARTTVDTALSMPKIRTCTPAGNIERNTFYPSAYQFYYVKRFCQNTILYQYQNSRNYGDIRETESLAQTCRYLLRNQIRSGNDLQRRQEELKGKKLELDARRKNLYCSGLGEKERETLKEYELLEKARSMAEVYAMEEMWEKLDDKLSKLDEKYPIQKWKQQELERKRRLKEIRKESTALYREEQVIAKIQEGKKSAKREVIECRPTIKKK